MTSGCTACPTAPCDLVAQCGCASGQACTTTYQPDGATTCREITKSGKGLNTCKSVEECAKGYLCMSIGTPWNRCKRFCNTDADCPDPRSICRAYDKGAVANTNFCTSNCDPMSDTITSTSGSSGCVKGYQCFALLTSDTGRPYSDCAKIGIAGLLESCSSASDCAVGLNCVFYPSAGLCMQECRLTAPKTPCVSPTYCVPYNKKLIIGGVHYGYCALP